MRKPLRIRAIILAISLLFCCFNGISFTAAQLNELSAYAASTNFLIEGDYTYTVSDGKATITEYTGAASSVTIPSELGGYPVVEIGCHYNGTADVGAFYGNTALISVTIPASVETLGCLAFRDCVSLANITFSESSVLTLIDAYAFYNCTSLRSISIPETVTMIRGSAFSGCTSLESISYPDSLSSVGTETLKSTKWFNNQPNGLVYNNKVLVGYKGTVSSALTVQSGTIVIAGSAFYNCTAVTSLLIPAETVYIGDNAFKGCTNLANVQLAAGSALHHMGDYVFTDTAWMNAKPNGVVMLGSVLCAYHGTMPVGYDLVIGSNVVSIASSALSWLPNLRSITIPSGVQYIACPESLSAPLSRLAPFMECTSLQSITVASDNLNYSSDEFGVLFNKDKTILLQYPYGNSRENYTVPETVEIIRGNSFGTNNGITALKTVDLRNVKIIEYTAFLNCKNLTDVIMPENLTFLGALAFSGCQGITSITIPSGITEIRRSCFYSCIALSNVSVSENVKIIGSRAFYNCTSLDWISLPDSAVSIADRAFYNCTALKTVIIPVNVTDIYSTAFTNCTNRTIYGFAGSYAQTFAANNSIPFAVINETADGWQYYTSSGKARIVRYTGSAVKPSIPASLGGNPVTVIGTRAFFGNEEISFMMIPSGITEIGDHAFYGCSSLIRIYIADTVTNFKSGAFGQCINMSSMYFAGNAPVLGTDVFEDVPSKFRVYYRTGTTGWTNSPWNGFATGIVPGDLDGNDVMNMTDAVLFVQQLAKGSAATYTNEQFICADIIRDGAVNMSDIVKMVQALANSSIVLE